MSDIRGVDERLEWFLKNNPVKAGRCAEHVMHALAAPMQGLPDATAEARKVQAEKHMQLGTAVPRGAIRYWDKGSDGHGHVGIESAPLSSPALVASVDVNGPATVGNRPFSWFAANWGTLRYLGWSWWWGGINTQPKETAVGWTEGQDQVIEKQNITIQAGKYAIVGRIDIPKPGSFLLTFQTRLPAGRYGRWQFTRDGWGKDPDGRDQTGPNPLTPPDSAATSFTHTHRIEGGGPVDFELKVSGSGPVTLPYVICKAERIT
jgi:hypothetical protein